MKSGDEDTQKPQPKPRSLWIACAGAAGSALDALSRETDPLEIAQAVEAEAAACADELAHPFATVTSSELASIVLD